MTDMQSFKAWPFLAAAHSRGEFCAVKNVEVLSMAQDPAQHPMTETTQVTLG